MKFLSILSLGVGLCIWPLTGYAQYSTAGLDLDGDIASWYDETAGMEYTGLVHGTFYRTENKAKKSHPYFQENSWKKGSLTFLKQKYGNVFMKYDIRRDVLIIENTSEMGASNQPLKVIQADIQDFSIFGYHFRYLAGDNSPDKSPGFYNILFQGQNLQLPVKRRKEESYDQSRNYWYYEQDRFFLSYNGNFYRISKKRSVLKVFGNLKTAIRQYARENNLSISTANETGLIAILRFCDHLTGAP